MQKQLQFLIALSTFFVSGLTLAQDFQGQAIYASKTDVGNDFKIEGKGMDDGMKQKLMESMKKALEKTFILTFNKSESVFEEEQKLESPAHSSAMVMKFVGGGGKKYKNIKNRMTVSEDEIFGKEFLVTDSLKKLSWQLQSETKKIGDYNCYKAVVIIPVTEEQKAEFAKLQKEVEKNKTQFITLDEPTETTIIAWYTPEIPVSNGPENYYGLPGLILEVNDGRTTFLCSKVTINPKNKVAIKAPVNGKKVTRAEFDKIEKDKLDSMKDENGAIRIEVRE